MMIYSNDIDLNTYKTFYAVATSGSFLKASEILYVSQPAISMAIKRLEEQLDVKLFKRNNKGIQLTEHGKQLLFYVETMFNTLNTAEKRLKEDKNLNNGEVRIGVPTHIGIFLVNDLIEGFKELYPGVKFLIENRSTQEMVNMLTKREIDIIIDSAPISTTLEDMEIINLMEFDNCFVANKKYEKLSKEIINFATLNKYQLLLPAGRTSSRINLEKEVSKEKADLKLKPIIEVSTTEMMYDLVIRGIGIGYFTKMSITDDIINNNLYEIKVNADLPKTQICMAYIPDFLSNANQEFINYTKTEINKKKIRARKELRLVYTQKCNYNCSFCHAEGIKNKIEEKLTNQEIVNFYKVLNSNYNISSVHITGGEPFLNNNMLDLLKKLKSEDARITITSNGYDIPTRSDVFEYLDKINISIHSLDKEKYEKISRVEGSYEKSLNNIKLLRNRFPILKIGINTTLTPDLEKDKDDLINIINFSESIQANMKIIELLPTYKNEEIVPTEKVIPILEELHYKLIKEEFRKKVYEKNGHKITLTKCTCSAVCDYKDKARACYENNDIYLSMDGDLHLCRKNDKVISVYEELHNNDYVNLDEKLDDYFEQLGEHCKEGNNE